MNPQYPVYVISKGRWKRPLTVRTLEQIGVPYRLVVEPQEQAEYADVIGHLGELLVLPFSNLGQGSIPARNWVWEHAKASGAARHWILDDNIKGFFRYHQNEALPVTSGTIFRCAEDFVDRYENVPMAGFHYEMFCHWTRDRGKEKPPFYLNTRVYSCILLDNSVQHRWRGRYNEDTDLSLRFLKDGLCTVLFCAFCCGKQATMTMKGGNTDELYAGSGRELMAESLREQHPDVVTVITRWNRKQHFVNYAPFKRNALRRKSGVVIPETHNNYGLRLVNGRWEDGE